MITIHEAKAADFATLGLGALLPSECTVRERAGGMYELKIVHPITDDGRHHRIKSMRIIKAPAPVRETPLVEIDQTGTIYRDIYKVVTDGRRLYLRVNPDSGSKGLHTYKPGTEVVSMELSADGKWRRVAILDGGATGWMWAGNLEFVRTETENIVGDTPGTVVQPRQTREQLFRVYFYSPDTKTRTITAEARHITYDLAGAVVDGEYSPENVPANQVCAQIMARADHDVSDFHIYCTITDPISGEYGGRNILDCLLDPETGIVAQTKARIVRDNYDIFILPDEVRSRGVELRYGKNLLSAYMDTDTSNTITRIKPVGKDKDGEPLYIDENGGWVESPYIDDYPVVYSKEVEYDVVESDELPINQARALLKEKAEADFAAGCDMAAVKLDADFVRLELTDDYKHLANQYALHLYDSVPVIDREADIVATARMTEYVYDAILDQYQDTGLGELDEVKSTIYGYELASGTVSGGKLIPNTVNGDRLQNQSVSYGKFDLAAIKHLSADAITAIRADIRELVAGNITTDQLYADLAVIAAAQITAANIEKANIKWAQIESLSAEIAKVVNAEIAKAEIDWAQIKNAQIDAADIANLTAAVAVIVKAEIAIAEIDWARIKNVEIETAQIKLGAITQALIAAGAIGTAQIADGSITSAKIVELSADVIKSGTLSTDRLLIKGAGGLFYEINATAGGLTSTQLTEEQYKNAISGTALVARSVTADKIAAKTITANEILSGTITAAEINVAHLFAADATIAALDNYILRTQTIEAIEGKLDVWANEKIRVAVTNAEQGLQTQITANADAILIEAGRRAGGTQLLKNGGFYGGLSNWLKMEYNVNGEWRNLYVDPVSPNDYRANEVPNLVLHAQYETGMFGAAQVVNGLRKNTQYTISGYAASHRSNRVGIEIRDTTASRWAMNPVFDVGWGGTNLSAYNRFEYTFDTGDYSDYQITLYSNNFGENAYVWWAQVKLEEGNTATAWSPHPDDPASGVDAGGVVRVDQTGVHMSGGTIEMETSDGDEYIHIRNDGISASSLSAPDVTPRYGGPGMLYVNPSATSAQIAAGNYFRSLADAFSKLNGHYISGEITVSCASGAALYGAAELVDTVGGKLIITGNGATLYGSLAFKRDSCSVQINGLNVSTSNGNAMTATNCGYIGMWSNTLNSFAGAAISMTGGGQLYATSCTLIGGGGMAANITTATLAVFIDCIGTGKIVVQHAALTAGGTVPLGGAENWGASLFNASGVTPTGPDGTPAAPVISTAVYDLLHADSYAAGNVNSWVYPEGKPNDDIYQGYTGQAGRICGCMWFDNAAIRSALNGKTIRQASIRLTAQRYVGYGREVTVYLRGTATSYSGRNGQPALTTDYGIIGTAEPAVTGTFTIPAQAISDIASGRIEGLVLYHQDTADMQGKNYSRNYMRFDGSTSGNAETRPRLTVVYQ